MINIALVGLPGTGKSTLGRKLSIRLNFKFLDSDCVIEKRIGCSIRSFFELEGEDAFRDVEQQVISQLSSCDGPFVLSTGGGAVLRLPNRSSLKQHACVFYLHGLPEDIYGRVRHDATRPLLQVADPMDSLRDLYAVRDPLYREVAHHTIEIARQSTSEVLLAILTKVQRDDFLS